jgi:hypothetical protein
LNELFNDAERTFGTNLEFEKQYKDIRHQVCKVLFQAISGRVAVEIPEKFSSVGSVSRA